MGDSNLLNAVHTQFISVFLINENTGNGIQETLCRVPEKTFTVGSHLNIGLN